MTCVRPTLLLMLSVSCVRAPGIGSGQLGAGSIDASSRGTLQWRGGPTTVIERDGLRLLTDPMLGPRSASAFVLPKHPSTGVVNAPVPRYTDPPSEPLGRIDLVVLSHNHADHFDQTAKDTLPKNVIFVLPPSAVAAVQHEGFTNLRPLDWNEETVVELGAARLRITAVPAHHAHDSALDASLGKGNGYVLSWEGESPYVAFWTGDSILSDDMRAVAARHAGVDLWLPHLGGVGSDGPALRTMDAEEAVEVMALLRPKRVIPIHHTTFGHYREPVSAFVQRAGSRGLGDRVTLVADGQTVGLGGAEAPPPLSEPSRRVLERTKLQGSDEELRLMLIEFPPGFASPPHLHPVVGLCYVSEGTAQSQYEGESLKTFHAGDSYQDAANTKHLVFRNASATQPLRFTCTAKLRAEQPFMVPL